MSLPINNIFQFGTFSPNEFGWLASFNLSRFLGGLVGHSKIFVSFRRLGFILTVRMI